MLAVGYAAAAAIVCGLAWLCARSSVYAITDRRVVIHGGMVVPATVNVPLARVESAAVKGYSDGTGDLALKLEGKDRLAYFLLWPHARPWRFDPTEPALRCVRNPAAVGEILRQAVAECQGMPLATPAPARAPVPLREPALAGD